MTSNAFAQALPPPAPSLALLGLEPLRAAFEYASMKLMDRAPLPKGDGHAVVIFPGLASDRHAVAPLRSFCEDLGYAAYDWGRGFNTGPEGNVDAWLDHLAADIHRITEQHAGNISLIGWSLGGIYAREVAKLLGARVRQVITIGSPFAGSAEQSNVGRVYRLLNGNKSLLDAAMLARLRTPPSAPTTSIYSRTDGIVAWQTCVQQGRYDHVDNVEVEGSHCGLGWNKAVFGVIAARLARTPRAVAN